MKSSEIKMADISQKAETQRKAIAQAELFMKKETLRKLIQGKLPKGDAFSCAKIAGIMAAKKTSELIPMCHPLEITDVKVAFETDANKGIVIIKTNASCVGRTGVEMEALTAACVAALTIYDMCKPIDTDIVISDIKLLKKTGGKSGTYVRKIKD